MSEVVCCSLQLVVGYCCCRSIAVRALASSLACELDSFHLSLAAYLPGIALGASGFSEDAPIPQSNTVVPYVGGNNKGTVVPQEKWSCKNGNPRDNPGIFKI